MSYSQFRQISEKENELLEQIQKCEYDLRAYKDSLYLCHRDMDNLESDKNGKYRIPYITWTILFGLALALTFAYIIVGIVIFSSSVSTMLTLGIMIGSGGAAVVIFTGIMTLIYWGKYRMEFGESDAQIAKACARGISNRKKRVNEIQANYNLITYKIKELEEELADLKEQLKEEQQKADEE